MQRVYSFADRGRARQMFAFAPRRAARRPSLTPMIDVVFLLLVFFMLAARFGVDVTLPLSTAGSVAPYEGPPRLVVIDPEGLSLNGISVTLEQLPERLATLMQARDQAVLVQPRSGVDLQRMIDVIDSLSASGLSRIVVVPGQ